MTAALDAIEEDFRGVARVRLLCEAVRAAIAFVDDDGRGHYLTLLVEALAPFRADHTRCPFGTCPSCDDTIEVGDFVVLLSKSFIGRVLAIHGPYLWVDPANPGEHPRSWMAECCARIAPPDPGVYWQVGVA